MSRTHTVEGRRRRRPPSRRPGSGSAPYVPTEPALPDRRSSPEGSRGRLAGAGSKEYRRRSGERVTSGEGTDRAVGGRGSAAAAGLRRPACFFFLLEKWRPALLTVLWASVGQQGPNYLLFRCSAAHQTGSPSVSHIDLSGPNTLMLIKKVLNLFNPPLIHCL